MLTREAILGADDLPVLDVPVPEWSDAVFVRTLTATENERLQAIAEEDNDRRFLGQYAALVICDADGKRLFTDDDAELLSGKNLAAMGRIVEAAQKHNRLSKAAREATEKNSETSQG